MIMGDSIRHRGKVEKVERDRVFVRLEEEVACSACQARKGCLASEGKETVIAVDDGSGRYSVNEEVTVSIQSAAGLRAAVVAFVIPLACVIVALTAGTVKSGSEIIGGLTGLAVLIPYYLILYVLRDKVKKRFVFTLSKAQDTSGEKPL